MVNELKKTLFFIQFVLFAILHSDLSISQVSTTSDTNDKNLKGIDFLKSKYENFTDRNSDYPLCQIGFNKDNCIGIDSGTFGNNLKFNYYGEFKNNKRSGYGVVEY